MTSEWDDWSDTEELAGSSAGEKALSDPAIRERAAYFTRELQVYLQDFVDPTVREEVNDQLGGKSFGILMEYYEDDARSNLTKYTIETELKRMRFSVAKEGVMLDTFDDVRAEMERNRCDVLLRLSNQSIFADIIEALQWRFLRPDLHISIINKASEFLLDFANGSLEASSLFAVTTIGLNWAPLEIAHIRAAVSVDTRRRTLAQRLLTPEVRMVFDEHFAAAGVTLATAEARDGSGECGGSSSDAFFEGNAPLIGVSALSRHLLRAGTDGIGAAAAAGSGLLGVVVKATRSAGGGAASGSAAAADDDGPIRLYRRDIGAESESSSSRRASQLQGLEERERTEGSCSSPSAAPNEQAGGGFWGLLGGIGGSISGLVRGEVEEEPVSLYRREAGAEEDESARRKRQQLQQKEPG